MTAEEIRALIQHGESSTVEFKVSTPVPEFLARLLSSFANTDGGTILVGVREPNVIAGTDPDRFRLLVPKGIARLSGHVAIRHEVVNIDGKSVGVINVSPAKIPIAAPDGYFRRVGDRQEPISAQQLVDRMAAMPDHDAAIQSLSETVALQTAEIARLRKSFEKANSWRRKTFYALIGAAATAIVKLMLGGLGLAS